MTSRPLVLLATCRALPAGEPGHGALEAALDARGLDSRWAVWDDESVDWAQADVVAVRSTWDYDGRVGEFLGWASGIGPSLLNGVEVFRWNTDKRYLLDLHAAALPVVPTVAADTVAEVRNAARSIGLAVVKPRVGAGGRGLSVVEDATSWEPGPASVGPWIVQPLVESIHHDGESSVFVIGGHPVSQVDKLPSTTDIRVHEQFGGTSRPVTLDPQAARLAAEAVAVTTELLAAEVVYARVDLMRHQGRLVVSEVEATEPGLYLDVRPQNADPFADAVLSVVERADRPVR
jgi:glutathione synthase/RimK-type ligase-like ATP-grasp enzyme